jgi:hypothetical protein
VVTQAPVEDGQDQAQAGVQFLGPQAGVEVADVVLPDHGQGPGGLHARVGEGLDGELGMFEHPDVGQGADLRPVVPLPGRQDDGHLLAVPGRQFLGNAIRERPVTAHDEVIAAAIRTPGKRRHAAIIVGTRTGDRRHPLVSRTRQQGSRNGAGRAFRLFDI